jgi:tellurium resistance protein TerZ
MAVNLVKGQRISLEKEAGKAVARVIMGLGWDTGREQIDLDASCALIGEDKSVLEAIYFSNKRSKNGSVQHSGDNLTGAGDGDDEQIKVDLGAVDAAVKHIVFAVTSYRGQKFTSVKNAFVRIVDEATGKELCRYSLSDQFPNTGVIMARLYRHNGEWKFAAIGEPADGRTVLDLKAKMQASIG